MVGAAHRTPTAASATKGDPAHISRPRLLDGLPVEAEPREVFAQDILTNCRVYPKDEAPAAYKDFNEVLKSVRLAGLASEVARLKARFVIKDSDDSLKGAA